MNLQDLLKTFTPHEQAEAQDAIEDHINNPAPHKPAGWYDLPLDKAWQLDAELKKIAQPEPKRTHHD
jgi:hypothetical protein